MIRLGHISEVGTGATCFGGGNAKCISDAADIQFQNLGRRCRRAHSAKRCCRVPSLLIVLRHEGRNTSDAGRHFLSQNEGR